MESCHVLNLGIKPLNLKAKAIREMWLPIIKIRPIEGSSLNVLNHMRNCDTLVFTSPRGPEILYGDLKRSNLLNEFMNALNERKVLAIGPSTRESLKKSFNIDNVLIPSRFTSKDLALFILKLVPPLSCVLLIRSLRGSNELPEVLSRSNIRYKEVFIYDEIINSENLSYLNDYIKSIKSHERLIIVLTSSLIAKTFCSNSRDFVKSNHTIVCIGPKTFRVTSKECKDRNPVLLLSKKFTYGSLKRLITKICGT